MLVSSSETVPISNTDSATDLSWSSSIEENGIVEQHQIMSEEVVATDPIIGTTLSAFSTEKKQSSTEVQIENLSRADTEISPNKTEIIEKAAENHNNEKTEIEATNETINTEKEKSLFSVVSIFRLLAKALKVAPHFFG